MIFSYLYNISKSEDIIFAIEYIVRLSFNSIYCISDSLVEAKLVQRIEYPKKKIMKKNCVFTTQRLY